MTVLSRGEITRNRTDAVDEQTGQDEIEDVEQGSPPHFDDVRDVRIRLRAARVVLGVVDRLEVDQVELAVRLVVAYVALLRLLLQIQLKIARKHTVNMWVSRGISRRHASHGKEARKQARENG